MQIEVFESAPSALNQLVRVRGDGAQPGGRATGGPARAHARGPGGRAADQGGRAADRAGAWAAADGPGRVRGLRGNRVPNFLVALAPGLSSSSLQHKIVLKMCIHPTLSMTIPPAPNSYSMLTRI